eukprot:5119766-Alexandrium_andersonii.AAC.1
MPGIRRGGKHSWRQHPTLGRRTKRGDPRTGHASVRPACSTGRLARLDANTLQRSTIPASEHEKGMR